MARRRTASIEGQLSLFPEPEMSPAPDSDDLALPVSDWERLRGSQLPADLRCGTSSWSFPGWSGRVYARSAAETTLARRGLFAYSRHPLLRAVGIDRSFYAPVPEADYRSYASQTPDDFRFLVKAPQALTAYRLRGEVNRDFMSLTASPAEQWLEPALRGLGPKLATVTLQFTPNPMSSADFAGRLQTLLQALPQGPVYSVELRNRALFAPPYLRTLERNAACHCVNVHPSMPGPLTQWRALPPQPLLPLRWMLRPSPLPSGSDWNHAEAEARYAPFNALVDEDLDTRSEIIQVWREAVERSVASMTLVNNKAEGCAPLSIQALIEEWFAPEAPF